MSGFPFSTRLRVRYSEIDGQRIVFNARYMEYADVAMTEFWRWARIPDSAPEWAGMEFNVVRATIEYKAPLRFDDEFDAWVRVGRIGRSSLTTHVELRRANDDQLCTAIELVSVHVDLERGVSAPLPDTVVAALRALSAR